MVTPTSNGQAAGAAGASADMRLALRAATLYYLDGLTQAEIASRLGVSRPTAGRLIARAKAKGLVRIEVVVPPNMRDDLHADEERELEHRFGLTEAVVAGHGIDVGAPGTARRIRQRRPRRGCLVDEAAIADRRSRIHLGPRTSRRGNRTGTGGREL